MGPSGTSGGGAVVRRILFHYPVLNWGGAEKSLLRLMAALADRGCEVHLALTSAGGPLEPEIDSRIHVHHLRGQRICALTRFFSGNQLALPALALCWAVGKLQEAYRRRRYRHIEFDAALAGITGVSPEFICRTVNARRRFVFVRNDPAVDHRGRWKAPIAVYHRSIDAYICVSEFVRRAMADHYPFIAEKTITIYNLLDPQGMLAQAGMGGDPFDDTGSAPRVLSVCRLQEHPKALVRMVEAHRCLLDMGAEHVWHVLGDGPDRPLLEEAIRAHGVSKTFFLHGSVANPFPYYKHADICAVLSRYEGLCGVVNEARVLERPVVATRFSGIDEQIEDRVNGLVVEQSVKAICDGLRELILDPDLRQRLARGGLPAALLDDSEKVERLLGLVAGQSN